MTNKLLESMVWLAVLGSGTVGGIFFAFSTFVMQGLGRLPVPHGVAAMQEINVTAVGRWFMALLFGTAVVCLVMGVMVLSRWHEPGMALRLAACVAYIVGAVVVTVAFNVPRNDALAAVSPDTALAASTWATYLREWVAFNHVRTVLCLVACALLLWAERAGRMSASL